MYLLLLVDSGESEGTSSPRRRKRITANCAVIKPRFGLEPDGYPCQTGDRRERMQGMGALGTAATVDLTVRSDARLVALVRAGEDEAFEELYRRYQRRLAGFVAKRVGDPARAEEITQEAFLSALRGLRASDAPIAWKPWLYEIARNATIDFHRRGRNTELVSVEQPERLRPLDRDRLVSSRAPDVVLDEKERFEHLRGAFDELPDNHHRVLVMRELEGLSYGEIAERLNLTNAAVESKLFRARRRLEREYDELASGRRCVAARATIALMAEGVETRADRRRVARHARRCSACRRHARELGVDPFSRRSWQARVGALLPLGWMLRRGSDANAGEAMLFGGQLTSSFAERTAALVAAGALAAAGTLTAGGGDIHVSRTRAEPVSAPAATRTVPSGAHGARVSGRSPATATSAKSGASWKRPARHERHAKPHRDRIAPRPAAPRQAAPGPAAAAPQTSAPASARPLPSVTLSVPKPARTVVADDAVKVPAVLPQLQQRLGVLDAVGQALHE
jgi:RNA polymerase sigma factor (sigma-70 family)